MKSIWREQTGTITAGAANGSQMEDCHWDVIIAGGGMAGLLTAYYLQQEKKRVLVIEAGKIASGQTERTTAKITSQHGLKYSRLIKTTGLKTAELYAQANETAIGEYERLIREHNIQCDFQRVPAFLYTLQDPGKLEQEAEAAQHAGVDAFFTKETELPFPVAGAVCFRNQAQFSPLEFVRHLAARLEILEDTRVLAVKDHQVITEKKTMTADKIVIATHYPIINVPGFYFMRQHQQRSYVLALSGCREIQGMYYGVDQEGLSFRQAGDYLLLGGGACRTGKHNGQNPYEMLRKAANQFFPGCREAVRWSAQDCMPHDGIPFIGQYSVFTPDLYVATGFQKWGMTSSMISAQILRDNLCGRNNPAEKVFSPQRWHIRAGVKNALADMGASIQGLTKGMFRKASGRCTHLGCALEWEAHEENWECPCHGSRFDADGILLDGPAQKNKKTH